MILSSMYRMITHNIHPLLQCKVIDQSLRAIENLYQLCIDNGAKKPIVLADNLEVQLQVIQV